MTKIAEMSKAAQDLMLEQAGYRIGQHQRHGGMSWGWGCPTGGDSHLRTEKDARERACGHLDREIERANKLMRIFPSQFKDTAKVAPKPPAG